MSYRVVKVDLSNVIDDGAKKQIIDNNTTISEVVILAMPVGVDSIRIGFGDNELFDIANPISFQPKGEDEQQRGLFIANPIAHPGTTLQIIVASGALNARGAK